MNELGRQKLLNWACSAMICIGYFSLAMLFQFLVNSENVFRLTHPDMQQYQAETAIAVVVNVIAFFILIALPIIVWHIGDFIQKGMPVSPPLRAITSYSWLIWIVLFTVVGALVVNSGVLASLHCPVDDPNDNFGVFCTPSPGRGVIPLVLVPWGLMTLIAVGKAVFAITSRLK